MKKYFLASLILIPYTIYSILNTGNVFAANSSNGNYNLEINDIDTSPENTQNVQQTTTAQELPEIEETSIGGIKSISQTAPLMFLMSSEIADFGSLSPGNPVTRNVELSIISSAIGYQILAFENHPLTGPDNQTIPDTTCDNGACSEYEYALWENQLTYGLGFRCDSPLDFLCLPSRIEPNFYRQFSDLQKNEAPKSVIIGKKGAEAKKAQINFKLNTSGNQKTGSYENTITFIAVPSY